jgi:sulfate adenylyltransferase subunit 1
MGNENMDAAFPPQSVTVRLEDEIDISRGDMIVADENQPSVSQDITFKFCWLSETPLVPGGKYSLKHTSKDVRCIIKSIDYKIDINTLEKNHEDKSVGLNEIGQMTIRTTQPLVFDAYDKNRITGSLLLVDEGTNNTVCAGMIVD